MTTAAMVVGMVPLIIATGAGAQSRFAIGLTIFFGMAIGTCFTLFVTPMVYTFLARDHAAWMAKERAAGHVTGALGEGGPRGRTRRERESALLICSWFRRARSRPRCRSRGRKSSRPRGRRREATDLGREG